MKDTTTDLNELVQNVSLTTPQIEPLSSSDHDDTNPDKSSVSVVNTKVITRTQTGDSQVQSTSISVGVDDTNSTDITSNVQPVSDGNTEGSTHTHQGTKARNTGDSQGQSSSNSDGEQVTNSTPITSNVKPVSEIVSNNNNNKSINVTHDLIDLSHATSSLCNTPRNHLPYTTVEDDDDAVDYSDDDDADDNNDYIQETYTEDNAPINVPCVISNEEFVERVVKHYTMDYQKSRAYFQDVKYGKINMEKIKKVVLGTKLLFDEYTERFDIKLDNYNRVSTYLSGLITNHDFDKGMREENSYCFYCPCSSKYKPWMDLLKIDGTIELNESNISKRSLSALMCHVVDIGIGNKHTPGDPWHYLISCYMYQLYGDKIGHSTLVRMELNVKKGKNSNKTRPARVC